jgi:dipeptidyl aminopeptidase/acylaminoacyl peptidase
MVIFKGENHSLSRTGTPTNLVERLERIIEWFERHAE